MGQSQEREIRIVKKIPIALVDADRRVVCTEAIDSLEVALKEYYASDAVMLTPHVILTVQIATVDRSGG